jgi:hypothetical protein
MPSVLPVDMRFSSTTSCRTIEARAAALKGCSLAQKPKFSCANRYCGSRYAAQNCTDDYGAGGAASCTFASAGKVLAVAGALRLLDTQDNFGVCRALVYAVAQQAAQSSESGPASVIDVMLADSSNRHGLRLCGRRILLCVACV